MKTIEDLATKVWELNNADTVNEVLVTIEFLKNSPHIEHDLLRDSLYKLGVVIDRNELAVVYDTSKRKFIVWVDNKTSREYKPSKFIRKVLSLTVDNTIYGYDWDFYKNRIDVLFPKMDNYVIKVLEDASEMYKPDFGIKSCMVGDEEGYAFYKLAPVKGVVCYYNNKPMARALLWELDDGQQFLDRIYAIDNYAEYLLKEWGVNNCFCIRANLTYRDSKLKDNYVVTPLFNHDEANAYLDTFSSLLIFQTHIKYFSSYRAAIKYKDTHPDEICSKKPLSMCDIPKNKKEWDDMVVVEGHYVCKHTFAQYKNKVYWVDDVPYLDVHAMIDGKLTHGLYQAECYDTGFVKPFAIECCVVLRNPGIFGSGYYTLYDLNKGVDKLKKLLKDDLDAKIVHGKELLEAYANKSK